MRRFLLTLGILFLAAQAQAQTPVTYNKIFRQGDIPAGNCAIPYINGVVASVWQNDVKSYWPDGSLKIDVVSYIDPAASSGVADTTLKQY